MEQVFIKKTKRQVDWKALYYISILNYFSLIFGYFFFYKLKPYLWCVKIWLVLKITEKRLKKTADCRLAKFDVLLF